VELAQLGDWSRHPHQGVRYFSGTAVYQRQIHVPVPGHDRRVWLNLGEVRETAVVGLNGRELATLWKPPYRVDLTEHLRPGHNILTVAVTNVWNNRLVGDARSDGPGVTRTNLSDKFRPGTPLLPSGWIGPARLEVEACVTVGLESPES
jgi:hypothetical protein